MPASSKDRPPIPAVTKRAVRRRCGYGCVMCGAPIYEYDHIQPWAEVQRHDVTNLTLLCPDHHSQKTKGLLALSDIQSANRDPINRRAGHTQPFRLRFPSQACEFQCGTQSLFSGSLRTTGKILIPILVHGLAPISVRFEDRNLLLNISGYDRYGDLKLSVKNSELVLAASSWDIEFIANRLKVRSGKGKFIIDVEFRPPNKIVIWRYFFEYKGSELSLSPDDLVVRYGRGNRVTLAGQGVIRATIGLNIGPRVSKVGVGIQVDDSNAE